MSYKLYITNKETGELVSDDNLMEQAGMDSYCGFEAAGIQDDGTPVVFNKCGDFGYLDPDKYIIHINIK